MHKLTDSEKREKKVLKTYRNCFMTQLAFIIVVITLAVLATPVAVVTMMVFLVFEILFYGYSILLLKLTEIESVLGEKGILLKK